MIANRFVFALLIAVVVSSLSLYFVIYRLNPEQDGLLAVGLFFVSFFFALSSSAALLGYGIRLVLYGDNVFMNHFNISLRQGLILGIGSSALLGLLVLRNCTWLTAGMVVVIMLLLELYGIAQE